MEKRYYFRGLGLGIIVTAVIMGIALSGGGKRERMTDDEVIARAKELGMIEDSTLLESSQEEVEGEQNGAETESVQKEDTRKDIAGAKQKEEAEQAADRDQEEEKPDVGSPESLQEKEDKAAEAEKTGEAEIPKGGDTSEDAGHKPSSDTNEMTKQDEDVPKPETAKSVTISSGDGSYTVATKLAEAGLVSSADSYDDFLCANGYDKRLRTGTFEIPAHASEEQIARIVTGQE